MRTGRGGCSGTLLVVVDSSGAMVMAGPGGLVGGTVVDATSGASDPSAGAISAASSTTSLATTAGTAAGTTTASSATPAVARPARRNVTVGDHAAPWIGRSIRRYDTSASTNVSAVDTANPPSVSSRHPRSRSSTSTGQWMR